MIYYNYHANIKRLIMEDKLIDYYFTLRHNHISPALVLVFNDPIHHTMPIRQHRWAEYANILLSSYSRLI